MIIVLTVDKYITKANHQALEDNGYVLNNFSASTIEYVSHFETVDYEYIALAAASKFLRQLDICVANFIVYCKYR